LIAGLEFLHELDLGGFFVDFGAQKHTGSKFVDLTLLSADGADHAFTAQLRRCLVAARANT
jgi:hypothetical protein